MPAKSALSWGDKDLRKVKSPEDLPEIFNFAAALLDRHLAEGRSSRVALLGPAGTLTYGELVRLANQAGNALRALGVDRENRVLELGPGAHPGRGHVLSKDLRLLGEQQRADRPRVQRQSQVL